MGFCTHGERFKDFRSQYWILKDNASFKTSIDNITLEINSVTVSENFAVKIVSICPVGAITLIEVPEIHLKISDSKCLGYACLQCIQLLHSEISLNQTF